MKTNIIHIRLDEETKRLLEKLAERESRKVSAMAVLILKTVLKDLESK